LKIKLISIIVITVALISVGTCHLHSHFSLISAKLNLLMKAYVNQNKFSGSVLVAQNGKILLCKGYGTSNHEHEVPNVPETKFRLGSITKQFTALAIMQLQEKGILNVNDPISNYIPNYPRGEEITIHNLLTHTSGIPNLTDFPEFEKKKIKPHTLEQVVNRFKDKPLEFNPGEKHRYSNSGYVLLSYIIEKASGKKYEDLLEQNIFIPLKMHNSGYDKASLILKNRAAGYSLGDDSKLENAPYIHMSFTTGSGALYSTVKDLYLWDQALCTEKLLSKKSLNTMFSSFLGNYGYGWMIGKTFNRKFVGHCGRIDGFATEIRRGIDDNICIIVLSNFEHSKPEEISDQIAAILFGEKYELPLNTPSKLLDSNVQQYSEVQN